MADAKSPMKTNGIDVVDVTFTSVAAIICHQRPRKMKTAQLSAGLLRGFRALG